MNNGVCPKCGGQILNNQNFCNTCGYQFTNMYNNFNVNNGVNVVNGMNQNGNSNMINSNMNINNSLNNGNSQTGKLIISRVKNFYGCAVNLDVYVNGYLYKIGNGNRCELDLLPGVYTITWKFWCRKDKFVQINVVSGNWYCIEFKPDYFWGGFKLTNKCKFY